MAMIQIPAFDDWVDASQVLRVSVESPVSIPSYAILLPSDTVVKVSFLSKGYIAYRVNEKTIGGNPEYDGECLDHVAESIRDEIAKRVSEATKQP